MDEEAFVGKLKEGSVSVLAKPNAKKTEVIGFDVERQAWRIAIAAPAEDDAANVELVRFLSKIAKRPVKILLGLTSRKKVVRFA